MGPQGFEGFSPEMSPFASMDPSMMAGIMGSPLAKYLQNLQGLQTPGTAGQPPGTGLAGQGQISPSGQPQQLPQGQAAPAGNISLPGGGVGAAALPPGGFRYQGLNNLGL